MTSSTEKKLSPYESPEITIYRMSFENILQASGGGEANAGGILGPPTDTGDWSDE